MAHDTNSKLTELRKHQRDAFSTQSKSRAKDTYREVQKKRAELGRFRDDHARFARHTHDVHSHGNVRTYFAPERGSHVTEFKALAKGGEEDARGVDKAGDNSWGALRGRLQMYALLPEATHPDAKRAAEIVTSLFGESGLSFLTEKYPEQHAIAESILRRIDEELLAEDIDRIAGKEFLANVRVQHVAYGNMVAAMLKRENALSEDMSEHVHAMGQGLVAYATKVLASVDQDKPATIKAAYAALRPIDVFRETSQARTSGSSPAAETPEVTPNAGEG